MNRNWKDKALYPYWLLPKNKNLIPSAKQLRKQGILAEVLFWNTFKNKENTSGWDIDRQVIIGNFIVDFFIAELGIVVEIDGSSHNEKKPYDDNRDNFLNSLGLLVVRYRNSDIKHNLDNVRIDLIETIEKRVTYLKESLA